jgi:hypothetical protein
MLHKNTLCRLHQQVSPLIFRFPGGAITKSTTESTTRSCHHVPRSMLFSVRKYSWRIDTIRDMGYSVFCDRIGKVSVIISSADSATTGIALTEMQTPGHVHSYHSVRYPHCTPARFTSPPLFFPRLIVGTMTPLACRDAPARSSHQMRIVFVAVDRTHAKRVQKIFSIL